MNFSDRIFSRGRREIDCRQHTRGKQRKITNTALAYIADVMKTWLLAAKRDEDLAHKVGIEDPEVERAEMLDADGEETECDYIATNTRFAFLRLQEMRPETVLYLGFVISFLIEGLLVFIADRWELDMPILGFVLVSAPFVAIIPSTSLFFLRKNKNIRHKRFYYLLWFAGAAIVVFLWFIYSFAGYLCWLGVVLLFLGLTVLLSLPCLTLHFQIKYKIIVCLLGMEPFFLFSLYEPLTRSSSYIRTLINALLGYEVLPFLYIQSAVVFALIAYLVAHARTKEREDNSGRENALNGE